MKKSCILALLAAHALVGPVVAAKPHSIRFQVRNGLVYVKANVNGQALRLIVDSGAAFTTIGAMLASPKIVSKITVATANGSSAAEVADVALSLDGYVMRRNVIVGAFKFTDADGVLGNDVLSNFKSACLDYRNSLLTLED